MAASACQCATDCPAPVLLVLVARSRLTACTYLAKLTMKLMLMVPATSELNYSDLFAAPFYRWLGVYASHHQIARRIRFEY